jgi:hypothetical protein
LAWGTVRWVGRPWPLPFHNQIESRQLINGNGNATNFEARFVIDVTMKRRQIAVSVVIAEEISAGRASNESVIAVVDAEDLIPVVAATTCFQDLANGDGYIIRAGNSSSNDDEAKLSSVVPSLDELDRVTENQTSLCEVFHTAEMDVQVVLVREPGSVPVACTSFSLRRSR